MTVVQGYCGGCCLGEVGGTKALQWKLVFKAGLLVSPCVNRESREQYKEGAESSPFSFSHTVSPQLFCTLIHTKSSSNLASELHPVSCELHGSQRSIYRKCHKDMTTLMDTMLARILSQIEPAIAANWPGMLSVQRILLTMEETLRLKAATNPS